MIRHLARLAAVILLAGVALVACGNDEPACAAPVVYNPPKPPAPKPPKINQPRTTSRVQDRPRNAATAPKPTSWSGYNDAVKNRKWSQPYRKGYEPAQPPVIVQYHNHDYRTYPGYVGYYPVGVWPIGYGPHYGCRAEREADAEITPTPTAPPGTPTVTVTVSPSLPATSSPSETLR